MDAARLRYDYRDAVNLVKYNLKHLTEKISDKETRLESVKQNGWSLEYVPEELRDSEMCLEAVKQTKDIPSSVPENLRDEEILWWGGEKNNYPAELWVSRVLKRQCYGGY